MTRAAGVWVVRGSGQEHLTAIRSPVLTGGGSCGGFLLLEDGIPVRPSGFCNVNQFIELVSEQAASVEVIRGPGNALFGSNALHGVINVLMPEPGENLRSQFSLEVGANDYFRLRADLPVKSGSPWMATAVYADDGGFRPDAGYQQGKIHIKRQASFAQGDLMLGFSATDLEQDTAGFIFGKDAYKDPDARKINLNPEAFRDANSERLYGIWTRSMPGFDLDVRPFVRHSDMEFLHHFQPGLPLEENGHISAGLISAATFTGENHQTVVGMDLEWSDVFLKQTQSQPATGSPAAVATRPLGKHYDYEVASLGLAAFAQAQYDFSDRLALGMGLRLDHLKYDYDNRMLDGNTRDDGSECNFGGCLFTRPGDRTDSFTNLAPKLSVSYQLDDRSLVYSSLARGFRAPQMLELYRLQNGQQVSDLESERLDSFEVGFRHLARDWSGDVVFYTMRKRDSVFRDAEGFNVTGARSRHKGIEAALDWQINPQWAVSLDATYARHTYDFNATGRGEKFVAGREMDSAPKLLASVEMQYDSGKRVRTALQWTTQGEYFLDAENRFQYPGHSLAHFRLSVMLNERADLILRLNNLTDKAMADRADYSNRNYRYFPGRGRELFAEIRYTPDD
jgi:outer membrane receptor protein involved in Fe transport